MDTSPNLEENKLIGQGLADIICGVLCKLDSHVLHSRFIHNLFVRFAMAFASILKHS